MLAKPVQRRVIHYGALIRCEKDGFEDVGYGSAVLLEGAHLWRSISNGSAAVVASIVLVYAYVC
jgi:hypothetical protein